jgi:large subunit ribosomal protein L18
MRRIARVRARVSGSAVRPRLAVARTLKHIYAQLIDDVSGKTLVAASDRELTAKSGKAGKGEKAKGGMKPIAIAEAVGKLLAERAKAKKIEAAVFDRRDKKYHGRVKALADGARAGGLIF